MRNLHLLLLFTIVLAGSVGTWLFWLQNGLERDASLHHDLARLRHQTRGLESKIDRLSRALEVASDTLEQRKKKARASTRREASDVGEASDGGRARAQQLSKRMSSLISPEHTTQEAMAVRTHAWEGLLHSGDDSSRCEPAALSNASRRLDYVVQAHQPFPSNCEGRTDVNGVPELCAALSKVAKRREVLVAVCDSNVLTQLEVFVQATLKASISNLLIIALDQPLADWCDSKGIARWLRKDSAKGSHKISAQKFKFIGTILSVGASVLVSDIDVVYFQDPFRFLYRDSDVEGTTDGWDPPTACETHEIRMYTRVTHPRVIESAPACTSDGWTEQVVDEALGWGRYSYTHRSTAWNSGLWFIQATSGGKRLMQLLAHRMATEETWDQTAYNEEVGLPARLGHSGAGITRRAANYYCFVNSKTLYRKVLRQPDLREHHRPVVLHVNYHQPKPPKMRAAYKFYHEGQFGLAQTELDNEPTAFLNTTQLEEDSWLQLNGGFVGGRALELSAQEAVRGDCKPSPPQLGFEYELHNIHAHGSQLPSCDDSSLLECSTLRALPFKRDSVQAILVVFHSTQLAALGLFVRALAPLDLEAPLVLAPVDEEASRGVLQLVDVGKMKKPSEFGAVLLPPPRSSDAGYAFELVAALLQAGVSTLLLSPRVVLLRDSPFRFLHRDADIEIGSDGWDDRSAYGYNHVLDDPSMGFTRNCHGLRIGAHDAGVIFALPTIEARQLMLVVARRLRTERGISAMRVVSEELFLPAHNGVIRAGARTRVTNLLCFGNSKLFFSSHLHEMYPRLRPVAVHVSYHKDAPAYMDALISRYQRRDSSALQPLLIERLSKEQRELCRLPRVYDEAVAAGSSWASHVQHAGPWEWSGMGPLQFRSGGLLSTPWGKGQWGVLRERYLFADFVGSQHNLKFDDARKGQFLSSRCGDGDPVVGRLVQRH